MLKILIETNLTSYMLIFMNIKPTKRAHRSSINLMSFHHEDAITSITTSTIHHIFIRQHFIPQPSILPPQPPKAPFIQQNNIKL
jgi:hypothetical protein